VRWVIRIHSTAATQDAAVRSSAEDLPGCWAAGQQETYLNVNVCVKGVWKFRRWVLCIPGLLEDRAISYRLKT